jgi:NADP-reducing hydrogenase subunit HndD
VANNKMIKLWIDNKEVEVPEGTTILSAAQKADIHIPTLCSGNRGTTSS